VASARAAEGSTALRLQFHSDEIGNLVFQIDCLGGLARCKVAAYRALWQERLGWSGDDDAQLERWCTAREPYRGRTMLEEGDPAGANSALPLPRPVLAFDTKIRIAGLQATSPEDYRDRLSLLLHPADATRLADVVQHFRPRFASWWRDAAGVQRAAMRRAARTLAHSGLDALLTRVARFYEAGLDIGQVLHVHFITRPPGGSPIMTGEQIEEHALVEIHSGEAPTERLDVVLHEIFHYFFASAPSASHTRLLAAFAQEADPLALHAYNLLDEALASALANGLARRRLRPASFAAYAAAPHSFYADAEIDRAAKALLPWVEPLLDRGSSLFDAPAEEIIRRIHDALGPSLARPVLGLCSHVVAFQAPNLAAVRDFLVSEARARVSYAFSSLDDEEAQRMLERHPGLAGVLLLRPGDLPRLAHWSRVVDGTIIAAAMHQPPGTGFIYGVRRSDKAYIYLVVAGDAAESQRLVGLLLDAPRPFEGFGP